MDLRATGLLLGSGWLAKMAALDVLAEVDLDFLVRRRNPRVTSGKVS